MRRVIGALIVLTAPAAVRAQEPVSLQHKFTLGQEAAYRLTATGLASIESDAPPGMGLPGGDLQLDIDVEFTERVEALGEGWAELAVQLQQASLSAFLLAGAFQVELQARLPEGDVEVLINGQLAPQEEEPNDIEPLLALAGMPLLVRTDATGRVVRLPQLDLLAVLSPLLDFQTMQADSTGFLPSQPVSVGDAWQQRQALPLALPTPDGTEQREVVADYVLKELTQVDGRDVARIGMNGKFALGDMRRFRWPGQPEPKPKEGEEEKEPAGLESLDTEVSGDIYFDWREGLVAGAELAVSANLSFSEWKKPKEQPGDRPQETEEPVPRVLIHTALKNVELTVMLERVW